MAVQLNRREALVGAAAGAGVWACGTNRVNASSANETINLGFISCGGRGRELMKVFSGLDGVQVAGLCDPDEQRLGNAKSRYTEAQAWKDMRSCFDDENIDAVVIATCNHWHCLAAIWAMQAGKHVYVEKPLSHSQWEGAQTVLAAQKYGRVCQLGTQQRSDPMQAEIKKFLHEEKGLGDIQTARVNRYGVRAPIGRRTTPLEISANVDFDLWLGPAQEKPIMRDRLQYDWHWDWNTGSGEMGNWGVHVLDDLRNVVFQDSVKLPQRIMGGGGRLVWDDAGETPNLHFVYFDTGSIPVVIGLTNIKAGPDQDGSPPHPGPGSGYIAYCEGGRFEGQRGRGRAFDNEGKLIRKFSGSSGMPEHQQNFLDAIRLNDSGLLNAPVTVGNDSTGWCNLANIAFLAGESFDSRRADECPAGEPWRGLLNEMNSTLSNYDLSLDNEQVQLSPLLELDPATEQFVGAEAERANRWLKREYRAPYVVPDLTT